MVALKRAFCDVYSSPGLHCLVLVVFLPNFCQLPSGRYLHGVRHKNCPAICYYLQLLHDVVQLFLQLNELSDGLHSQALVTLELAQRIAQPALS